MKKLLYFSADGPVIRKLPVENCVILRNQQAQTLTDEHKT